MDHLPPELQAIQDDRQGVYGNFHSNMRGTSKQIAGLLENMEPPDGQTTPDIPGWFAPLVMVVVKLNRIASGNYKKDNFDDLKVYLSFMETMQQEQEASDG